MEAFASMGTGHPQKKRSFSDCDKTNPMVNNNQVKSKSAGGLVGNTFQLVLSHFSMRLVIDSFDVAAILIWPDYPQEINDRASAGDVVCPRSKRRRCY